MKLLKKCKKIKSFDFKHKYEKYSLKIIPVPLKYITNFSGSAGFAIILYLMNNPFKFFIT
jgi:hypothetical protein